MEFPELEAHLEQLRLQVDDLLTKSQDEFNYLDTVTPVIRNAMNHSLFARGKRIRPILAYESTKLFDPKKDIGLELGLCIELLHTYSLIHDDLPCMDNSDLRRGLLTCHKAYGEDIATLAGDALLTSAWELLISTCRKYQIDSELCLKLILTLSRAVGVGGMIAGQVLDLQSEGQQVSLEIMEEIHVHKTGKLFMACLEFGALISGANDVQITAIKTYGQNFGLVFQITDDILDITSSSEQLGKQAGLDLTNDKSTYPGLLGIKQSQVLAEEFASSGKQALFLLKNEGLNTDFFEALIDYLLVRTN